MGDHDKPDVKSTPPDSTGKESEISEQKRGQSPTKSKEESTGPREPVVVGIGASAGGLEAYKRLLRNIPENSGLAFVFVQHLDPTHESLMVELLSKYTTMPVSQIEDATPIESNHVYMIPPNRFVKIADRGLYLEEPVTKRGVRLPIDHFFSSLAETRKERAICVVLSGTGSDGAEGLRQVKVGGGMTIVQKPDTAEYDGMPRSAMNTGAVDFVLPIEEMADVIIPYAKHPYVQAVPSATLAETAPDHFRAMLSLLRAHTDHDFSRYKKGTLTRRIDRRMGIRHISKPADYLKLLREDGEELRNLFKDMLIGVTRFFRDSNVWDDLANVLTRIVQDKADEEPYRIWVPGCASGEEAYTIAMLMFEQQQRHNRRLDLQVFATDIDADAIDIARIGIYPEGAAKDLTDSRIDSFFQREGEKLRVRKKLRETCIFAAQNLLSDPPFSNLDLICCRNLLIYLESDVQRPVFEMMHFALKPGGLLLLGTSESPAKRKHLFEVVSQTSRIYRKIGESKPGSGGFPIDGKRSRTTHESSSDSDLATAQAVGSVELSRRALLERYAPASVVVNARGVIQYIHGSVRKYLDLPSGEPELDICAMAVDGLKAKVRRALQRARSTDELVSMVAPRVRRDGKSVRVRLHLQVLPAGKASEPLYVVSFFDEPTHDSKAVEDSIDYAADDPADESDTRDEAEHQSSDRQLALELQATREDLQSTIEELESANEELKASNEEVMSMNEELQSTNEELETSREELQSLNEELSTVNNQLHDKVEELEATTNDLTNLLSSTDMATLFLDSDLRIRRFTPATVRLMSLLDSDIGRPLNDLAPRVDDPDLESDAKEVLRTLMPAEKQVHNGGGHSYMRRITPFRTSDNKIEGVVVTFSDVTSLQKAASQVEFRERQQAVVAKLGRAALAGEELNSLLDRTVASVAETLGVEFSKVLRLSSDRKRLRLMAGVGWKEGLVGEATVPSGIDSQAGYTLQAASPVIVENLKKEKRFSGPQLLIDNDVVSGMSVIIGPEENPWGVLGIHSRKQMEFTVDDTHFVQAVANLLWEAIDREQIEHRFRALVNASAQIVWTTNAAGEVVEDSPSWRSFTGQTFEQWKGIGWLNAIHPDDQKRVERAWRNAVEKGSPLEVEYRVKHTSGEWKWMDVRAIPLTEFDESVRGWVGMNIDITRDKLAEEHQSRLAAIIESTDDAIIGKSLDGTISSWNQGAEALYGYTADEMVGESVGKLIPDDRPDELEEILEQLRQGKAIHQFETVRQCKDNTFRDVSLTISPIRNSVDEIIGASAIARDVTHQKRLERQLEEARQKAEAANEAKSAFLANMSHELRTPMTAILGYTELLQATLNDADAQACVRTIKENGGYLCEILNDILDLSKIEAGKLEAHLEHFSLVNVLANIRSLMAVRATEKSLSLSIEFEGRIPETVESDPKLVRQVLVNLVGNAIKFTDAGGIQIHVKCHEAEERIEICVVDTGVGIPPERVEGLFEPFEQLDSSSTRAAGGSGLGLSISKQFARMLGGSIAVESELGVGSTFRFSFSTGALTDSVWLFPDPSSLQSAPEGSFPQEQLKLSGRILAVDDRREIRFLVRKFIDWTGAKVENAENGQKALEAWQAGRVRGTPYDLILMDIQMPVMDGLDATRKLRAEGFRGPVIALTANAMQHDRQAVMEAGFDDFVAKPIDRAELLEKVELWLRRASQSEEHTKGDEQLAILCVDDNSSVCSMQKLLLEQDGHQVQTATSGQDALNVVKEFTPQIAFLDLGLPNMSGSELLIQLRTMPALANCVFVCLSGRGEDEVDWREMGFDAYIQKPAQIEKLNRLIDQTRQKT